MNPQRENKRTGKSDNGTCRESLKANYGNIAVYCISRPSVN
jgi:hypothetical protein